MPTKEASAGPSFGDSYATVPITRTKSTARSHPRLAASTRGLSLRRRLDHGRRQSPALSHGGRPLAIPAVAAQGLARKVIGVPGFRVLGDEQESRHPRRHARFSSVPGGSSRPVCTSAPAGSLAAILQTRRSATCALSAQGRCGADARRRISGARRAGLAGGRRGWFTPIRGKRPALISVAASRAEQRRLGATQVAAAAVQRTISPASGGDRSPSRACEPDAAVAN